MDLRRVLGREHFIEGVQKAKARPFAEYDAPSHAPSKRERGENFNFQSMGRFTEWKNLFSEYLFPVEFFTKTFIH